MSYDLPGELTAEHIQAAQDLGASRVLLALAIQHPERADIEDNFVTDRLTSVLEDLDGEINPSSERLEQMGHFMTALWHGNIAMAITRADIRNMKLIFNTLSDAYLMAVIVSEQGSVESAERYIERREEHL